MNDEAVLLRYQSITGPREVQVVPVKQMGRVRYQVLANDVRLAFAGSFFTTPRQAMEEVERTLRARYGGDQPLEWVLCVNGFETPVSPDRIRDLWRS